MSTYVPGTQEKDLSKVIMSIQAIGSLGDTNATNIATNTANIATNTANIATNTANITALQVVGATVKNSLAADVSLTDNAYHDGPSCSQGTTGTWLAVGSVTVVDNSAAASFSAKLSVADGATLSIKPINLPLPILRAALKQNSGNIS